VLAAVTNAPLRRMQMALQWSESPQFRRVVMTDPEGRYEFADLPAGKFSLTASKPGYVALQYGQRRPYESGTSIALREAETISSIDFALPRGGVIAGRITDELGEVMPQVQVQAQRFTYGVDGQRRLSSAGSATTDDRGEFRIYGLMPGEYVVQGGFRNLNVVSIAGITNPADPSEGYPPTFYPGTPNAADAQPVSIGIGEEVNIQFGLIAGRLSRISGTVRDSEGRPGVAQVIALPQNGQISSSSISQTWGEPDGSFTLASVPAGEYSLQVVITSRGATAIAEAASIPIVVTGNDITGLRITTSKGAVISGRVIWEGTSPKTPQFPTNPLRVGVTVADPSGLSLGLGSDPNATGELDDSGRFRLGGVSGRVFLSGPNANGWTLKSVTVEGRDVTDAPLDPTGREAIDDVRITMTDKLTNVSGHVTDDRGSPLMQYVVVVQPADEVDPSIATKYVRTSRPDTNGRFEFRALRPGRYVATAIESLEQGRQGSPDFRRQLRRGAREFTLREGETLTLDLRLTPGL
jgi:protocatechuate 3,4-dioxygenase beta subunit